MENLYIFFHFYFIFKLKGGDKMKIDVLKKKLNEDMKSIIESFVENKTSRTITLFEIGNLLDFYKATYIKLIKNDSFWNWEK